MSTILNKHKLSDIAKVIRGVSYGSNDGQKRQLENHLPVLRAGNIQDCLLLEKDLVWVPNTKVSLDQLIKQHDIIMCSSSGSSAVVGKSARAESDWQGSFGAFCVGIRPEQQKCDPSYLSHYLRSPAFTSWSSLSAGANIKNIRKSELEDFEIPLPPLPEQKRIAAILDKADSIRRMQQEAARLTEELLRSVFLDMFGDPVTNPKGWEEVTIRDLVTEVKYGTSDKASYEGEYPVLRMNNITYLGGWNLTDLKRIDIPEKELSKYLVQKGDILFNRTNSKELVGKTAVYRRDDPMAYAGYLIRIRPNKQNNSEYIAAYLNSTHGKKILESMCKNIVGMANINAQELQEIPILQPPMGLQNHYASIVTSVEKAKEKLKASSEVTDTLFNSLLQRAFAGEL